MIGRRIAAIRPEVQRSTVQRQDFQRCKRGLVTVHGLRQKLRGTFFAEPGFPLLRHGQRIPAAENGRV